jgi:hypothetical protein
LIESAGPDTCIRDKQKKVGPTGEESALMVYKLDRQLEIVVEFVWAWMKPMTPIPMMALIATVE